jgi:pimeloyl-ACP methyl ester carboxylesterase
VGRVKWVVRRGLPAQRFGRPIVFVGHSSGGAVITNAATGNDQVKALVYLNGSMPDEGESVQQLSESSPAAFSPRPSCRCRSRTETGRRAAISTSIVTVPRGLRRRRGSGDGGGDGSRAAAAQRSRVGEPSGPPTWKSIPSWYLLGSEDRAIPPETQRFMAERANAQIVTVRPSHASIVRAGRCDAADS